MKRKQKIPRRLRPTDIWEPEHIMEPTQQLPTEPSPDANLMQITEPLQELPTQPSPDANLVQITEPLQELPTQPSPDASLVQITEQELKTQSSPDVSIKRPKLEAETQTFEIDTQTPCSITQTSKVLDGVFKNESESPGLPLILDVYSLSDVQLKKLNPVPKQNNGFPVTPPCSPPLVVQQNPMIQQYYQYSKTLPRNTIPQHMVVLGDSRVQYYNPHVMVDNLNRIANGVLPAVDRPMHHQAGQNTHGHQNQNTAVNYFNNPPPSYFENRGRNPIDQLRQMLTPANNYLVKQSSDPSKLYTQFRPQQNPNDTQFLTPAASTFPLQQTPNDSRNMQAQQFVTQAAGTFPLQQNPNDPQNRHAQQFLTPATFPLQQTPSGETRPFITPAAGTFPPKQTPNDSQSRHAQQFLTPATFALQPNPNGSQNRQVAGTFPQLQAPNDSQHGQTQQFLTPAAGTFPQQQTPNDSQNTQTNQSATLTGKFRLDQRPEWENVVVNNDFSTRISSAVRENELENRNGSPSSNILGSKANYKTGVYGVVLHGYGKNELLYKQSQQTQTGALPINLYQAINYRQRSEPSTEEISYSNENGDVLSRSEVKVQRLRKLLEEQEQALKKLRTIH